MPDKPDPFALLQDAFEEAQEKVKENLRYMKAEVVNRPAMGERLTRQERIASYTLFREDIPRVISTYDQLAARYKLSKDKPIPRRLVDYFLRGEREIREQE